MSIMQPLFGQHENLGEAPLAQPVRAPEIKGGVKQTKPGMMAMVRFIERR
jgi:hypothetical protein